VAACVRRKEKLEVVGNSLSHRTPVDSIVRGNDEFGKKEESNHYSKEQGHQSAFSNKRKRKERAF